ncbi:MAG TPA: nuclear transport factor 2 family protein [Sediminibacterium sp.]
MYKVLLVLSILVTTTGSAQTGSAEDSVKIAIGNLFTAMRNSDSKALLACFADSALLQTIVRDKDGGIRIKNEKLVDFATVVGTMPKAAADERITFDVVKIDGPLASVWTPYHFYFNGQFSHCGVNSFQMIRQNGNWKIQYLIDTRRKQGCE